MDNKTALLILDVQNIFFSEQAPIYKGEEVLKSIIEIKEKAEREGALVIATQHLFGNMFGFDIDNTQGGEIRHEINNTINILKSTPNPFLKKKLHQLLRENKIEKVIITGFQSEYCVDTSCRAAKSLGYDVTLISDAHTTYDNEFIKAETLINHTNLTMSNAFARVISSDEI